MNSLATPEPAHICHLDVGPEFAVARRGMLMPDPSSGLVHSRYATGSDGVRSAFSESSDASGRRGILQAEGVKGTDLFVSDPRTRYSPGPKPS
jgi:hypothetical protein